MKVFFVVAIAYAVIAGVLFELSVWSAAFDNVYGVIGNLLLSAVCLAVSVALVRRAA